ncbi:unnamed protein product [Schistocephalus solidus]|uniref:CUB domain-containing protein n=2 Tax=Schistocephalus solidus TaxID=70667 RepID=A0A183SM58_SCHSO|nr:unnamed protein product [Schistocephalus solidus]
MPASKLVKQRIITRLNRMSNILLLRGKSGKLKDAIEVEADRQWKLHGTLGHRPLSAELHTPSSSWPRPPVHESSSSANENSSCRCSALAANREAPEGQAISRRHRTLSESSGYPYMGQQPLNVTWHLTRDNIPIELVLDTSDFTVCCNGREVRNIEFLLRQRDAKPTRGRRSTSVDFQQGQLCLTFTFYATPRRRFAALIRAAFTSTISLGYEDVVSQVTSAEKLTHLVRFGLKLNHWKLRINSLDGS